MARLVVRGDETGFAFTNKTGSDIANGSVVTVGGLHGVLANSVDLLEDGKSAHAEFVVPGVRSYQITLNNPLAGDLALGADVVAAAGVAYTATTDDDGLLAALGAAGTVVAISNDAVGPASTDGTTIPAAVTGESILYVAVI